MLKNRYTDYDDASLAAIACSYTFISDSLVLLFRTRKVPCPRIPIISRKFEEVGPRTKCPIDHQTEFSQIFKTEVAVILRRFQVAG